MFAFRQRLIALLAVAASLFGVSASMNAQASRSATEYPDSRVDIYGGYGYFHPINSGVGSKQYFDVNNMNGTVSVKGYFNRYVGIAMEGGYFSGAAVLLSNKVIFASKDHNTLISASSRSCYHHITGAIQFGTNPTVHVPCRPRHQRAPSKGCRGTLYRQCV